jgi:hypothetical protein
MPKLADYLVRRNQNIATATVSRARKPSLRNILIDLFYHYTWVLIPIYLIRFKTEMKTAKMISKSRPITELNRVNREPSKLRLRSSPMRFRIELIVVLFERFINSCDVCSDCHRADAFQKQRIALWKALWGQKMRLIERDSASFTFIVALKVAISFLIAI